MADWFKLQENWFNEPRLQWAIKESPGVIPTWLWILTECCRTKSDTVGLHGEDYEMLGIQQLLNISPGIFNMSLGLLTKIKYIEVDKDLKTIRVLRWNDFQSDYLRKRCTPKIDSVRQCPTVSDTLPVEERRLEEIRKETEVALQAPVTMKASKRIVLKETTPFREFINLWSKSYQDVLGTNYVVSSGDEVNLKKLLASGVDTAEALSLAEKAWRSPASGKNAFERGHALQISSFFSQYNKIRGAFGEAVKPVIRKSSQEIEDEYRALAVKGNV